MTSDFIRKTILIGAAQVLDRFMGLLVMPVMTGSFSVSDYAMWAQMILFVGVLTPVFSMGIFNANVKFLPAVSDKKIKKEINGLVACILLIVFTATSFIFILFSEGVAVFLLGSKEFQDIILSAMLLLFSEIMFEYAVSVQRSLNNIGFLSKPLIFKSLFRAFILCLLCFYSLDIDILIQRYSLSMTVFSVISSAYLLRDNIAFKARVSQKHKSFLKNVVAHCVPLFFVNILIGANSMIDRLTLVQFKNNILVGQYAVNFSVFGLIVLVYSALSFSLLPHLRHEMLKMSSSYIKGYYSLLILYFSLAIFYSLYLTFFGQLFVELLSNNSYVLPKPEILIMCLNGCLIGAYYIASFPVILSESPRALLKLYVQTFLIHLCLSLLLVSNLDLLGVLIGGLVSQIFLVMNTLSKVSKIFSSSMFELFTVKWALSHVFWLFAASTLITNFDMSYYSAFFSACIFGGVFILINRDLITEISRKKGLQL